MSLATARYYGNPRNALWRLLEAVGVADLNAAPYEDRLERLMAARIALWDVIAEAHRPGSLDTAIRNEAPNDLAGLIARMPDLRAVAFNGGKAAKLGMKVLAGVAPEVERIALPSSSPAHTLAFERKAAAWAELRRPLGLAG